MSHEITEQDGIALAEQPAWHGLGTVFDHPMTVQEAFDASGLSSWDVGLQPLYLADGTAVEGHQALVRSDTGRVFNVVGRQYTPLQNRDIAKFFDDIIGQTAGVEAAGSIMGGARVWALARMPGDIHLEANHDDAIRRYFLLANGHDGTLAVRAFMTPIRVVCNNTLSAALANGGSDGVTLRHTPNLQQRLQAAKRLLGFVDKHYKRMSDVANFLSSEPVRAEQFERYVKTLFPDNPEAESHTRTRNIRDRVAECFMGERNGLPGIRGTWWAAWNAVTEYIDHRRTSRKTEAATARENRFVSTTMGTGARIKSDALGYAVAGALGRAFQPGEVGLPTVTVDGTELFEELLKRSVSSKALNGSRAHIGN